MLLSVGERERRRKRDWHLGERDHSSVASGLGSLALRRLPVWRHAKDIAKELPAFAIPVCLEALALNLPLSGNGRSYLKWR